MVRENRETEREREYLGGAREPIATLADGDVEDQLLDFDLPHRVGLLPLRRLKFLMALVPITSLTHTAQAQRERETMTVQNSEQQKWRADGRKRRKLGFFNLCMGRWVENEPGNCGDPTRARCLGFDPLIVIS